MPRRRLKQPHVLRPVRLHGYNVRQLIEGVREGEAAPDLEDFARTATLDEVFLFFSSTARLTWLLWALDRRLVTRIWSGPTESAVVLMASAWLRGVPLTESDFPDIGHDAARITRKKRLQTADAVDRLMQEIKSREEFRIVALWRVDGDLDVSEACSLSLRVGLQRRIVGQFLREVAGHDTSHMAGSGIAT